MKRAPAEASAKPFGVSPRQLLGFGNPLPLGSVPQQDFSVVAQHIRSALSAHARQEEATPADQSGPSSAREALPAEVPSPRKLAFSGSRALLGMGSQAAGVMHLGAAFAGPAKLMSPSQSASQLSSSSAGPGSESSFAFSSSSAASPGGFMTVLPVSNPQPVAPSPRPTEQQQQGGASSARSLRNTSAEHLFSSSSSSASFASTMGTSSSSSSLTGRAAVSSSLAAITTPTSLAAAISRDRSVDPSSGRDLAGVAARSVLAAAHAAAVSAALQSAAAALHQAHDAAGVTEGEGEGGPAGKAPGTLYAGAAKREGTFASRYPVGYRIRHAGAGGSDVSAIDGTPFGADSLFDEGAAAVTGTASGARDGLGTGAKARPPAPGGLVSSLRSMALGAAVHVTPLHHGGEAASESTAPAPPLPLRRPSADSRLFLAFPRPFPPHRPPRLATSVATGRAWTAPRCAWAS